MFANIIDLGLTTWVADYNDLTNMRLESYFQKEREEVHSTMKLQSVESIVMRKVRMDILNSNAPSNIKKLFMDWNALLCKHKMTSINDGHEKVLVQNVSS